MTPAYLFEVAFYKFWRQRATAIAKIPDGAVKPCWHGESITGHWCSLANLLNPSVPTQEGQLSCLWTLQPRKKKRHQKEQPQKATQAHNPACAQGCNFSIVRANFQKYDLYSAPIARALPRYIVLFFKFFKTGKCFKTMLFPVSSVSQKPLAFQKHSLLLIQPKTHAKTLSERSEKCATVQVLTGTDNVARATYLQRAL